MKAQCAQQADMVRVKLAGVLSGAPVSLRLEEQSSQHLLIRKKREKRMFLRDKILSLKTSGKCNF